MRIAMVAALLAATLAGCSDDSAPAEDETGFEDLDAKATDTTGVIRGIVINDAVVPVADATIAIVNTDRETTSNENGAFAFGDLDAGTYFLRISKPGYKEIQQAADVVAGVDDPDIVKVLLSIEPGSLPFINEVSFKGYVGCSYQVANVVGRNGCEDAGDPDRGQIIDFGDATLPHVVQTELKWEFTQPIGERLTIIEFAATEEGAQRLGNVWGTSPLTCKVTRDAVCDNGDGTGGGGTGLNGTDWDGRVEMRVYANCFQTCVPDTALGLGLVLQQEYEQFATAFYNFEPDEGWTFLRDGPHPVPGS